MTKFWHELTPQVLCVAFAAGVLGNIAAAALCGTPALWHLHRKLDRQHAERTVQAARHHAAQLDALAGLAKAEAARLASQQKTARGGAARKTS